MLHVADSSPQSKSHVTELLDSIHVPSLEVTNISHPPIFKGAYSDVYQGVFGGKIVCSISLSGNHY
jgi:hypothetical protein